MMVTPVLSVYQKVIHIQFTATKAQDYYIVATTYESGYTHDGQGSVFLNDVEC